MKPASKVVLGVAVCVVVAAAVWTLRRNASLVALETAPLVPAPPALPETNPVPDLPEVPAGAFVFDLKYRGQTGAADDVEYHSYWGFGGREGEQSDFLKEVEKQAGKVYRVYNAVLSDRAWSAVEYEGKRILAFYFDLNADGKLADNERIPPTRLAGSQSVEFVTPDFRLRAGRGTDPGGEGLFRVLLRASRYAGSGEPNFMWSPACVLEGTASINGAPARLLLFADGFGSAFTRFGSSTCALLVGDSAAKPGAYIPRETLSSLVRCAGQFYHVKFEGRRSSGHPARAVLTKDTSPTGTLAVKLQGKGPVPCTLGHAYLHGTDDPAVFFNVSDPADKLPVGSYALERGDLHYGGANGKEWQVSFTDGPKATLQADQRIEVAMGEPTLTVRAINEQDRYNREAKESAVFKQGDRVFLEPKLLGRNREVLTRFRRSSGSGGAPTDVPPSLKITTAEGKEVLAKTMEYG
jgi:hypothetical protein